jgi:threonine dehydrogenase-like Zn-dependent dehydrogenase
MDAVMNRALTIRSGQTHVQRYLRPLLERIQRGELDATFIITHHMSLDQAPLGYQIFRAKRDGCVKVVLDPWRAAA